MRKCLVEKVYSHAGHGDCINLCNFPLESPIGTAVQYSSIVCILIDLTDLLSGKPVVTRAVQRGILAAILVGLVVYRCIKTLRRRRRLQRRSA